MSNPEGLTTRRQTRKPIDARIRNAVIALQAFEFQTTASCEGHLNWGEPYPWIDVGITSEASSKETRSAGRKRRVFANQRNLRAQERMLKILDFFYTDRTIPYATRLAIIPLGFFGGVSIDTSRQLGPAITAQATAQRDASQISTGIREFRPFSAIQVHRCSQQGNSLLNFASPKPPMEALHLTCRVRRKLDRHLFFWMADVRVRAEDAPHSLSQG
jgi:hypothetical protein